MKACLLTRTFTSGGIGRVSSEIRDGLVARGHEVYSISSPTEGLLGYFRFVFWNIRGQIPKGYDIYHAITPMESIWIPKSKSVCTVLDIIAITGGNRYGGRLGGNRLLSTVGRFVFLLGLRQALKCQKIVCISEYVRQEVLNRYRVDNRKVSVIRLGVPGELLV